jgi:LAO/AO transport system kinase
MELVKKMLGGDSQSLSRLISLVERNDSRLPEIIQEIHPYVGKGSVVGITGPPGAGKSTLVDRFTRIARNKGLSVGIIAVDPTSPFTGGAVLGDRVRMQQHYLDPGVFIRSMATRGSRGGLPRTARDVIKLMDASGKDLILVETVGVGQTELDVVEAAETIIVVLVPEAGDSIQTMKAGLLEIASIFVVNKADREGADRIIQDLESMLALSSRKRQWKPPVVSAQAVNDIGTDELYQMVETHREYLQTSGELRHRRKLQRREELIQRLEQTVQTRLYQLLVLDDKVMSLVEKMESGDIDSYTAADIIVREVFPFLTTR